MRKLKFLLLIVLLIPLSNIRAQDAAPKLHIGEVQGAIPDDMDNANTFDSPYVNQRVQVAGIVTNVIVIDSSGRTVYGFFLQEAADATDGDPTTSDGIGVLSGPKLGFGDYALRVGDMLTVEGKVEEYYEYTRLREVKLISMDGHVEDLEATVPRVELNPQGDPAEIYRMYERIESMRVFVPNGAMVVSPTHLYSSSNDTEIYVVRGDHPIMSRENVYERRVFRDVHPLDEGQDAGNLYRISIEANILKAQAQDYNVNLPAYATFEVFSDPLTGNIVYAFERYTLQIDAFKPSSSAFAPEANDPLPAPDLATQFRVATFNVENLYDFYDDPFDREDNPADMSLNYVPRTMEEYQSKVEKVARQILEGLQAPDIIGFQEIEDQDVCSAGGQWYGTCASDVDNADGLPDVLQDVAKQIETMSNGTVIYTAAIDRDSADDRGISQGFLYRTDRVELIPATETHPVLGARTPESNDRYALNNEVSNPKSLNNSLGVATDTFERPPLVGHFRVFQGEASVEVYFIVNHFKSNPEENTALHTAQSEWNRSLVHDLQAENPDVLIIVGGDLNSFPESAEMQVLDTELVNVSEQFPPASDYTYVFAGQAQTLDYLFITPSLAEQLVDAHTVHVNADYGYQHGDDPSTIYHAGDHDPIVAIFKFVK